MGDLSACKSKQTLIQLLTVNTGYSEFMDYSAVDALPNPGYGGAIGMPVGGLGNQDVNIDLLM
jgi:hypothetical protein